MFCSQKCEVWPCWISLYFNASIWFFIAFWMGKYVIDPSFNVPKNKIKIKNQFIHKMNDWVTKGFFVCFFEDIPSKMSGWYNCPDIIMKENSLLNNLTEYFGIIFYYQSFSKNAALLIYIWGGGDLSIMTNKIHMVQPTHMQHAGVKKQKWRPCGR